MEQSNEPAAVDLKDSERAFVVSWAGGGETRLPYRRMRQHCRCAGCVDEVTGELILDVEAVPEDLGVEDCEEVGLYGVRIHWTDGHKTGIYTWDRIRELGS